MSDFSQLIAPLIGFALLAMASRQVGALFARWRLPLISGFLVVGMVVGPYALGFITADGLGSLRFIDQLSLAFIALAAGNELHLDELRDRLRSIAWVTVGLVVTTFVMGSAAVYLLAEMLPFTASMGSGARIAVAMLAGSILVARSPSSAIAIVKEMRAKGPFTHTVLGVTVFMDVVVITLFGFTSSIADTLVRDLGLEVGFVGLLAGELVISVGMGIGLAGLLHQLLGFSRRKRHKALAVVLLGLCVFVLCEYLGTLSQSVLGAHLAPKPLLVCVFAGFLVTNFSHHRPEFSETIREVGPAIYLAFFTLAGASLALDVVVGFWHVAAALFAVRFASLFLGSFLGGMVAGDPRRHSRLYGLAFVTQAGVGLGLAKSVAITFPGWGSEFASLIIAIIVVNQLVGPPLFKAVLSMVGESRLRGAHDTGKVRHAVIFGLEGHSVALASQLHAHGWWVKIAARRKVPREELPEANAQIVHVPDLGLESLRKLEVDKADTIVTMLSCEANLAICQLAYEHFGTPNMVVRLHKREKLEAFDELGAIVVDPASAMVGLMDHMVRSPLAASVILGTEVGQDIVEIEVTDPSVHGKRLRDLRMPLDTLVLSVSRDGHVLVSHGYTRLSKGDHVTVIGSEESLEQVTVMLEK